MKIFRSFILSPSVTIKLGTLVFSASAILFLILVLKFDYGEEMRIVKSAYYSEDHMSGFQAEMSFYFRDLWCDDKLGGGLNAPQYVEIDDESKIKSALVYARVYLMVDQEKRLLVEMNSGKSQLFVNGELALDSSQLVGDLSLSKGVNEILLKSIVASNKDVIDIRFFSDGREVELSDYGRLRNCTE